MWLASADVSGQVLDHSLPVGSYRHDSIQQNAA